MSVPLQFADAAIAGGFRRAGDSPAHSSGGHFAPAISLTAAMQLDRCSSASSSEMISIREQELPPPLCEQPG